MKRTSTLFVSPLILGMVIGLRGIHWEAHGGWWWCLILPAILVLGFVIGAVLNFAVLAPAYWLLGQLRSRRTHSDAQTE